MASGKGASRGERSRRSALAAPRGRLYSAFAKIVRELDELRARYSLIGGLAVGARIEPRTTKDIDFAVDVEDDAQAEALVFALSGRGYKVASLFQRKDGRIATVRTYGDAPVFIDYLFASTRIERETVAASTRAAVFGLRVPVAQPWHLLAMKIKANRPHDSIDTQNLIERMDAGQLRKATAALRLMQARGANPERNYVAELLARIAAVRRVDDDMVPVTGARLRKFTALRNRRRPR